MKERVVVKDNDEDFRFSIEVDAKDKWALKRAIDKIKRRLTNKVEK